MLYLLYLDLFPSVIIILHFSCSGKKAWKWNNEVLKRIFLLLWKCFIIYSKMTLWDTFNTKRNFEETEACRLLPSSSHWEIQLQTNFPSDKISVQLKEQLFVHTFTAASMTYYRRSFSYPWQCTKRNVFLIAYKSFSAITLIFLISEFWSLYCSSWNQRSIHKQINKTILIARKWRTTSWKLDCWKLKKYIFPFQHSHLNLLLMKKIR